MKRFLKYFNVVLLLALASALLYGTTHSRKILDYLALRNYEPSAKIVELANRTTMNDKTRNVFYVNHPELQNKQQFKNSCTEQEQTIVLGCFITNEGIYLLIVSDPRLAGIVEVTTAHEVLHAMYDRLSNDERNNVDKMTNDFFNKLDNPRIKQNIENYRKKDPKIVPNELHSILASEVRDLSPELETYYAKYFKDRKAVVDMSEKYEKTFTDIENQVKSYDEQLKNLKVELEAKEQKIKILDTRINSERQRLDSLIKANRIDEYNASVEGFNALILEFNKIVNMRQAQADEYNRIVDEYNKLATTEQDLVKQLKTNEIQTIDQAQ